MNWSTILQIFLMLNVFLVGGLVVIGLQHAYAHFHPEASKGPKPDHQSAPQPAFNPKPGELTDLPKPAEDSHLSPAIRQRWIASAEEHFADSLTRTTIQLENDLQQAIESMTRQLEKMGNEMANDEMARYRQVLEQLRSQAAVGISGLGKVAAEQQAAIREELVKQAAAARVELANQLDARLADSVTAFLTETLQHEVDLGAQQPYLLKQLEEHKAELISEVTRDDK